MPALFCMQKWKKLHEKNVKKQTKMYRHFKSNVVRLKRIHGGLFIMNFRKEETSELIEIYNQICSFLTFLEKEKETAKIDEKED